MNQRLTYPDICKFIAIFMVTWSHSAQCIADKTYTNLWGGTEFDIAFNMPLFMIISGWFINLEKYRHTTIKAFLISKFKRLIVPSIIWFLIYAITSGLVPSISLSSLLWYIIAMFNYYWYLSGLFVCLSVILLSAKIIKNNTTCILLSTIGVLICPLSEFANINFMFPFIWVGLLLRKILEGKYKIHFITFCIIVGVCLCPFWDAKHTIYESPLKLLQLSTSMCITYVYRFIMGCSLSTIIIYSVMCYEKSCLKKMAVWGHDTLTIYTASILILNLFSKYLTIKELHTNQYILLDILSFILCTIIVFIIIAFCRLCRKFKWSKTILLGE